MGRLTDIQLQSWVRSGKKIAGRSDGDGLTFTLSSRGRASWVYRYRHAGRQHELTIGNYPAVTLKRARALVLEARLKVLKGVDVAREKQEQIRALAKAGTVEELCNEYFERTVQGRVKRPDIVKEILDKNIVPKLGRLRVAEVKPMDVDRLIRGIVDRGAPVMANRVLTQTKSIFGYAIRRHWIEQNPAAAFTTKDAGGEERARTRALSETELKKLFKAMRDAGPVFRLYDLAIKLLLATAVRKSELIEASWAEFDLECQEPVWRIPAQRLKTQKSMAQRDFVIPLPPLVVKWLLEVQHTSVRSDYVFPARRRTSKPTLSPETLNWALGEISHGCEAFTLHDLRRTVIPPFLEAARSRVKQPWPAAV